MKIDKEAQEYYAQLTAFYQQFRRIGNNYNQMCIRDSNRFAEEFSDRLEEIADVGRHPVTCDCLAG